MRLQPFRMLLALLLGAVALGPWVATAAQPLPDCSGVIHRHLLSADIELDDSCVTNRSIILPDGANFDGNGNTIHVEDPPGQPFLGGVLVKEGGSATIAHVGIEGSGLGPGCASGPFAGIMFRAATAHVSDVRIVRIRRTGEDACDADTGFGVLLVQQGPEPSTIAQSHILDIGLAGIAVNDHVAILTDNLVEQAVGAYMAFKPTGRIDLTGNEAKAVVVGLSANSGSTATLHGDRFSEGVGTGLGAYEGGTVTANGVEITGATLGADALVGGLIVLANSTIHGSTSIGARASGDGSSLRIEGGSVTDSARLGVGAADGAHALLRATKVTDIVPFAVAAESGASLEVLDDTLLDGTETGLTVDGTGTHATVVGSRISLGDVSAVEAGEGAILELRDCRIGPAAASAPPLAPLAPAATPSAAASVPGSRASTGPLVEPMPLPVARQPIRTFGMTARDRQTGTMLAINSAPSGIGPLATHRGTAVAPRVLAHRARVLDRVSGDHPEGDSGSLPTMLDTAKLGISHGFDVRVSGSGTVARLTHNVVSGAPRHGVVIDDGAAATVVGNVVEQVAATGIVAYGQNTNAVITNNEVRDAGTTGIEVSGGAKGSVNTNQVERSGQVGIRVAGAGTRGTVSGNQIGSPGVNGINVEEDATATVAGNTVEPVPTGAGIVVFGGASADVENGNRVAGGKWGMLVSGQGTRATFTNNVVTNPALDGILITAGATATLRDNRVSGGKYGVDVDLAGSDATIIGQHVTGTTENGMLANNAARMTVEASEIADSPSGITAANGASATLNGPNRVSGGSWGISAIGAGSSVTVVGAAVSGQRNQALSVVGGATLTAVNTQASDADIGAMAASGGTLRLGPGVEIRGADSYGVLVTEPGSTGNLRDTEVVFDSGQGVVAKQGGALTIASTTISGESAGLGLVGASARDPNSTLTIAGSQVTVRDRAGIGVSVSLKAMLSLTGSSVHAVTGVKATGAGTTATVRDSRVADGTTAGLLVNQAAANIDGVLVTAASLGIDLRDSPRAGVTDTTIALRPAAPSGAPARAIRVDGGTAILRGNDIVAVTGTVFEVDDCGIWVGPGSEAALAGNTIRLPGNATPVCDERAGPASATPAATPVR